MKKLVFILAMLPVMLFAQQSGSFKIAKPIIAKADTLKHKRPLYFPMSIADHQVISSISDLYKVNKHPNEIQNRFDLNFSAPWSVKLGSTPIILYAQSGITTCRLTPSNSTAYSIPLRVGFLHSISWFHFYADAGPQFFSPCAEPTLSGRTIFDWGGGAGYITANLSLNISLEYRRLGNINMEGVRLIFLI